MTCCEIIARHLGKAGYRSRWPMRWAFRRAEDGRSRTWDCYVIFPREQGRLAFIASGDRPVGNSLPIKIAIGVLGVLVAVVASLLGLLQLQVHWIEY
jgi:hypothetical protein